jgi:hypothetical protein
MNLKILCLVLICLAVIPLPAKASTISFNLSSPVIAGSTFDVAVQVNDLFSGRTPDDALLAYGFNVGIGNNSILHYIGETPGPLFQDVPIFGGNPMVAGIATDPLGIPPSAVDGPLTLAILHFSALICGTTSISVTSDSSDPNQGLVYFDLPYGSINGSINVTAVPEPSTLLLLAPAIGGLLIFRRRLQPSPGAPRRKLST